MEKEKTKKKDDCIKIKTTFNNNGESFQTLMERILIEKIIKN